MDSMRPSRHLRAPQRSVAIVLLLDARDHPVELAARDRGLAIAAFPDLGQCHRRAAVGAGILERPRLVAARDPDRTLESPLLGERLHAAIAEHDAAAL